MLSDKITSCADDDVLLATLRTIQQRPKTRVRLRQGRQRDPPLNPSLSSGSSAAHPFPPIAAPNPFQDDLYHWADVMDRFDAVFASCAPAELRAASLAAEKMEHEEAEKKDKSAKPTAAAAEGTDAPDAAAAAAAAASGGQTEPAGEAVAGDASTGDASTAAAKPDPLHMPIFQAGEVRIFVPFLSFTGKAP